MTSKADTKDARRLWAAAWYAARMVLRLNPSLFFAGLFDELFNRTAPFAEAWIAAQVITRLPKLADASERLGAVHAIGVLLAGLLLVRFALQAEASLYQLYQTRQELRLNGLIRRQLTEKFAQLPYRRYEEKSVMDQYDLAQRYSDRIGDFVLFRMRSVAGSAYAIVLSAVAIVHVSLVLALILALAAVPQVLLEFRVNREQRKQWRESTVSRRLASAYEDLFRPASIKDSRLFGLVRYALDRAMHYTKLSQEEQVQIDRGAEKYRLALKGLDAAVEIGALAYIVRLIYIGSQPVGQFVFLQQVMQQYTGALGNMTWIIQDLDEYLAGSIEFQLFMQLPDRAKGVSEFDVHQAIVLDRVSFQYPAADKPALRDVSLTIKPGQTVAFVGENGAGKTTLVKLLMKLYEPTKGHVSIGTLDLNHADEDAWHDHLGVLFQDFISFIDFTVRENVHFGRMAYKDEDARIVTALKKAGAYDFVRQLPKGIDTYLGTYMDEENGTMLSGGQLQRLAIARVLYRNPDILIMDEPTSAVDAKAEYEIFRELEASRQGKTTILISHRFSTVRKADYIFVLDHGRLVEQGTHAELVAQNGTYAELFNSQADGYR